MITNLLTSVNKELEELNHQLKDNDYLYDLEERIKIINESINKTHQENKELNKEIERLNKELKSLQDSYDIEEEQANYHIDLTDDLREEVDRLNNIINELESYIIENSFGSPANNCSVIETYKVLDKLQELKGSDKVE